LGLPQVHESMNVKKSALQIRSRLARKNIRDHDVAFNKRIAIADRDILQKKSTLYNSQKKRITLRY